VTRSSYYRWKRTGSGRASSEDQQILEAIGELHKDKRMRCYGSRRMVQVLRGLGFTVGRKRVRRLMREGGRYYLPALLARVGVPGRCHRFVFQKSDRLVDSTHPAPAFGHRCLDNGTWKAGLSCGADFSFRPRQPVCQPAVPPTAPAQSDDCKHVRKGRLLG
jgi:transposase InsO family protein